MARTPLPDSLDSAAFTVRMARAQGVSPKRLRGADLAAPFHGIRATGPADSVLDLCRAYQPRLAAGQFFSHVTAAAIYGIPLPAALERAQVLHVSARPPDYPPRTRRVVGHRISVEARTHRGLPVTDPVTTWMHLAAVLSLEDLIVAGDSLVRRKQPLATLEQLHAAVAVGSGRGIRMLRSALGQVRHGTDSPMETRLRLALVAGGLPEPEIGHTVLDASRGFVATPDLAYVGERIAIEYEGEDHWMNRRVFAEDIERREALEDAGWQVIRVIAAHLGAKSPQLLRRVRAALDARAAG